MNLRNILFVLLLASAFFSCSKSGSNMPFNTSYTLPSSPEANAAHDLSNYGIYKGVVINAQDSTATFKFNFYNNSAQPYALFYRDLKVEDSLIRYKSDVSGLMMFPQEADNSVVPLNAALYYTYFSSYRKGYGPIAGFNVKAGGMLPVMEVQLYNNQTLNAIKKETSTSQVTCFEGAYEGLDSGRVAFVMNADSVTMIRASIWNPQFYKSVSDKRIGAAFTVTQFDDISGLTFVFNGTVSGNNCSGTWTRSSQPAVINHFSVKRTL